MKTASRAGLNARSGEEMENRSPIFRFFRCVRKTAKSDYELRHVYPSAWNISAHTARIFMKIDTWVFSEKLSRKFTFNLNQIRMTGTLHEDQHTLFIMSCSVLLRMRNVSDKRCRGNQNTHFVLNTPFFPRKSCRSWDNVEKYGRARQATDNTTYEHCMLNT